MSEIGDIVFELAEDVMEALGPGHSEAVYEGALEVELSLKNLGVVRRQVPAPITYKGLVIGAGRIDIMVGDVLIIEVKTVMKIGDRDLIQLRRYLTATGVAAGVLLNFNVEGVEMLEVP